MDSKNSLLWDIFCDILSELTILDWMASVNRIVTLTSHFSVDDFSTRIAIVLHFPNATSYLETYLLGNFSLGKKNI